MSDENMLKSLFRRLLRCSLDPSNAKDTSGVLNLGSGLETSKEVLAISREDGGGVSGRLSTTIEGISVGQPLNHEV